ncbi:MAG: hypothetical protein HQL65_09640 [Magnetococcales bacterium]|nr:hypothetical protein [Magnetococcales bacterium]
MAGLLFIFFPVSLYLGPVEGDLTRMGYWAERDFGLNKSQRPVSIINDYNPPAQSDIMVLGDSFSIDTYWQSELSAILNKSIQTYEYTRSGCVDNWVQWLLNIKHATVKLVIMEVIERQFMTFSRIIPCRTFIPQPVHSAHSRTSLLTKMDLPENRRVYSLSPQYLYHTLRNTIRMTRTNSLLVSGIVVNVPLKRSDLFSNRRSDRMLHLDEHDAKSRWSVSDMQQSITNLRQLQAQFRAKNIEFVLVVVPDKSNVYKQYMENGAPLPEVFDVFQETFTAGLSAVNLLTYFRGLLPEIMDLYRPNDTHLSQEGYRLMARVLAENMKLP